jgi:hypothetical protein
MNCSKHYRKDPVVQVQSAKSQLKSFQCTRDENPNLLIDVFGSLWYRLELV